MEQIRVLHCLETVGFGGVEQMHFSLVKELDPERYEQHLVCTKANGGFPEQFEQARCLITEVVYSTASLIVGRIKKLLQLPGNFVLTSSTALSMKVLPWRPWLVDWGECLL